MSTTDAHEHDGEHHEHHIIPLKVYLTVFGSLIALTIITVLTARVDLGILNVPLAMTIAGFKCTLVVMYFMALKYDKKINVLVFSVGIMFVLIFMGITMLDTELRGYLADEKGVVLLEEEIKARELARRDSLVAPVLELTPVVNNPDGSMAAPVEIPGLESAEPEVEGHDYGEAGHGEGSHDESSGGQEGDPDH